MMKKNDARAEFNALLNNLSVFCKENAIPMFVATWDETHTQNAGYSHKKVLPAQVGVDIASYGVNDKFPLFVRIVSGKEDLDE